MHEGYPVIKESVIVKYLGCGVMSGEEFGYNFNFFHIFVHVRLGMGMGMGSNTATLHQFVCFNAPSALYNAHLHFKSILCRKLPQSVEQRVCTRDDKPWSDDRLH